MSHQSRALALKERLSGSPSRRAAYYTLVQASYSCLAGSFEMPMACRIVGRVDLVALVYACQFGTLFLGFALGMALLRGGKASALYRAAICLWACLALSVAAFFPFINGMGALTVYFLVRGLGDGFYWSARHRSFMWSVSDAGRDRFALKLQASVVALSVVLPLVGGFAITYLGGRPAAGSDGAAAASVLPQGYRPVFLIAGCAMLLSLALSPRLEIGKSPLSLRSMIGVLGLREARLWCAYICIGGFAGAMLSVAAGIQTFGILRTEFKVGGFTAAIALLSSISLFALGGLASRKSGMRLKGAFAGSIADFASRCIFALAPTTFGLVVKSLLDSLIVPLKSLLGENVIFALIDRLGRTSKGGGGDAARTGVRAASTAELYVFREFLLEVSRVVGCVAAGLVYLAISGSGAADAPGLAARVLIGLAAPVALVDFLFIRSFARSNAEARSD